MGWLEGAKEPAFDLLVACADQRRDGDREERIARTAEALRGDWDGFVDLTERHHLTMLCAQALRDAGIEPPARLADLATRQKRRALDLAGESVRLVDLLQGSGCEVALIKGPLLSQQLFGDLAMRRSIDIDLLVEWSDFRAALDILRAHGYTLRGHEPPWDDWRIEHWRGLAKDVTLVDPKGQIAVELHHRLKSPASLLPGLGLAQATELETFAGRQMKVFGRADLFAYLCVHAATSFWDRLKWLVDIHALTVGMEMTELQRWQAHSRSLGTERCTALGLLLCHRIWGQKIPEEIARWPKRARWLHDLENASISRMRKPERAYTSFANSIDRRHLSELRHDVAYARAHWSDILNDRELLETVKLPRSLRTLYFPLRIALFIRRKLGFAPDPRFRKQS